jgi:hyaluronan synthase
VQQRAKRAPASSPGGPVPGCLNESYQIPVVTFRQRRARGVALTTLLIAGVVGWRVVYALHHGLSLTLLACVTPVLAFKAASWLLSWKDQPARASAKDSKRLDRLCVVVTVPVYNEDPALLDRCLYALVNQSRPPQRVDVIDDGSRIDYSELRRHWEGDQPGGARIRWARQTNQGKRRAHCATFASAPEADIFVTVDSDTTLEARALEEGLKPFTDPRVMSVAGIEMGFNAAANTLTRVQSSLQLYSQVVMGAAWSAAGDMYTNRGPFALYRAIMIREIIPLYGDEMFFGRRVILGDDSLLALCATGRGKSVQQLTAFGLTMWPETLSHHLRQRLRWARGRAVRNFWRLRYRPILSYCWWFTTLGIYSFLSALSLLVLLPLSWPASAHTVADLLLATFTWHCLNQLRVFCFHRSDEAWADRLVMIFIRPISSLWASLVLACLVRAFGTLTCLRQGWTTRQQGAELVYAPGGTGAAA